MKKKKTHVWERERIDPLMEQYQRAYKLHKWGECDRLYPEIRKEHEKLLKSWLNIKKIPTDHETMNDMLSHMHHVMVKYWKPNTGKSSMSYFIMAISTLCAQYWSGTLASSTLIRMPPGKWAVLEEHPVQNKRKDKKRIRQSLEDRGYENDDYVVRKAGKQWQVVRKDVGGFERLDAGNDIQEVNWVDGFDDVCLETLKEYVPDVVTSRQYHDLARCIIDLVDTIRNTHISLAGRGVQLWLKSALNERLDWAVTVPDMKMGLFVVRQAYKYYWEDFPPEPETLYGQGGYITSSTNGHEV